MTQIKKTKSNHFRKIKKGGDSKLGKEFGAIIENNPANYPNIGDWKNSIFTVGKKCIGCTQCVQHCPESAIMMKKIKGKMVAVIDPEFCKGCGICKNVCPVAAIEISDVQK